jgi:hypothetical protein
LGFYGWVVFPLASFASSFATAVGLVAGTIAVGGFLSHVKPALSGVSEVELRKATAIGGLAGLGVGSFVVILSAFIR